MNKNLLAMTALAAMLFAGCTSSDDLTTRETITKANEAATPINFGTYMGKTGTRAGATGDIVNPNAASGNKLGSTSYEFGVIAYNHTAVWNTAKGTATPNFMYNQKVSTSDNGTTWTYSPVKYWPNGEDGNNSTTPSNSASQDNTYGKYVSFFAYAPFVDKSSAALSGAGITKINDAAEIIGSEPDAKGNRMVGEPTVDYALASTNNAASNVDLLWGLRNTSQYGLADETDATHVAGTTYNTDLTKQNAKEKVSFLFKHALSKMGGSNGLKIVADLDGNGDGENGWGAKDATTLITVKAITIKNAENGVTLTGTFNLATGVWTATNGIVGEGGLLNLDFNPDGSSSKIQLNEKIAEPATPPTWNTSAWSMTGVPAGGNSSSLSSDPVAVSIYNAAGDAFYLIPGNADQTLEVVVDYIVRTYDPNLAAPSGGETTCSKVEQIITNTVTLPAATLQPNKYFTLVIHLGLTSVKFTASVADWETVTGTDAKEVWLPSNVVPTVTP